MQRHHQRDAAGSDEDKILASLSSSDYKVLSSSSILDWGPKFLTNAAANGRRYRVDIDRSSQVLRRLRLDNGRERSVVREPAPGRPGMMPWDVYAQPGASFRYCDDPRHEPTKLFCDSKWVPYPAGAN